MKPISPQAVEASDAAAAAQPLTIPAERSQRPSRDNTTWTMPGFAPMTRIATSFGHVPAVALRERDLVRTETGAYLQITRIDRISLDEEFLRYHPDANPVMIRAGSLGKDRPANDILLSPRQDICGRQNDLPGEKIAAGDLVGRPNIHRMPETSIVYTLFECGEPACVLTEGLWVPH